MEHNELVSNNDSPYGEVCEVLILTMRPTMMGIQTQVLRLRDLSYPAIPVAAVRGY